MLLHVHIANKLTKVSSNENVKHGVKFTQTAIHVS